MPRPFAFRVLKGRTAGKMATVCAVAAATLTLAPAPQASAVPARTQGGWSVILCRFSDVPATPQTPAFFSNMFGGAGAGTGGLYDYFKNQSYGKLKLSATVRGWYNMPFTLAEEAGKSRGAKIDDCVATATAAGYSVPSGNRVAVITNAQQDSGSAGGRVLLDPGAWNIRFAAHEMGHGYGLDHSFSNDLTYQNASWSQPGEYDDLWDEMSAQHVYSVAGANYGQTGVGFNAFHRDKLGWIPRSRIVTFGANGTGAATVSLAPLQVPSAAGALLVRVPFNPGDLFNYYTVEFQRKLGWSRGIPGDTVLIHEVKDGRPTLIRRLDLVGKPPAQAISANGVSISVSSTSGNLARVSITSDIARRCVQGYVWREAQPGDLVCVLPDTRAQAWADNAVKASRWVPGPFDPHTCISGYVWREAFAGDDVCVLPENRTLAASDTTQAAARRNPARFVYGPNTCKAGYVWRDADMSDYVCVTGSTRAQAAQDNAVKASRWVPGPFGPHTCISGYVWREAWQGDDVCVLPATRTQTRIDSSQVGARVERTSG